MSYLMALVLLGAVILVHELGHLVAAKCSKIPVERFSIGFGPRLFGIKWDETDYCLSLLPLGGYVLPLVQDHDEFSRFPLRSRIAFCLGGPLFNLIGAWVCLMVANGLSAHTSVLSVAGESFVEMLRLMHGMLVSIPELFRHPDRLSGIVGIVAAGGRSAQAGIAWAASFWVLLNVNLAVFNLLPLPPLDGGKIVFSVLEAIWKPLKRLQVPVAVTGWAFMLALMLYATVHDIGRLVVAS
ncbi:MAG: site-2 protease family protein [Syntrophobacteraceae bacterium]